MVETDTFGSGLEQYYYRMRKVARNFKINADHQTLKFLLNQKVTTLSQHTWLAKLVAYNFEIQYKHGKEKCDCRCFVHNNFI